MIAGGVIQEFLAWSCQFACHKVILSKLGERERDREKGGRVDTAQQIQHIKIECKYNKIRYGGVGLY